MIARVGGALLVLIALSASFGHALQAHFVVAALVWVLCLRQHASVGLVLAVAAGTRVPFLFSDFFTDDLFRYVWEGRVQLAGFSPYVHAPADPALAYLRDASHARINHPEFTSIYPPFAQLLFAGATGLGLAAEGLRNLILLVDIAVVGVVVSWLRSTGRPAGWAIVYAWCPVVVASAGSGHVDPLMLLFLAGALRAWDVERFRTAALLLGAAILAKTSAVLLVPWLVVRRPRAGLVVLGVLALGYYPHASSGLFDSLYAFGTDFAFNGSLFRVFEWLAPGAAHGIVATLLVSWVALVTLTQPRIADAAVLLFAGLLLLSPTVHYWYLTWFLVALPAVGPRRWTLPLVVWTVSCALSSETYRAHFAGAGWAEHYPLTWIEYGLPLLCAIWLVWRGWPRRAPLCPPVTRGTPGSYAVIVPCRGEVENLRRLVPRWLETGVTRVILADTPTGDGTAEFAGERVTYLPVERRGYGAAAQAGLAAAGDVDYAVICDADHALGPDQVDALLAPLHDGDVGLVASARTDARLTLPQRFGNELSTFLIGLGWGRRFHDLGPFRALRRSSWPAGALRDTGYGWNVEMNVRALELGMGVVEVPLPGSERAFGRNRISGTFAGVVRTGYGILSQLYRLREQSCRLPSSS